LPDADVKIFLTASPADRAKRRFDENARRGIACDFDTLRRDIEQRDYNDATRAVSPLRPADDAILMDTSGNTLEQSISLIIQKIKGELA
jgi:cytidylate kinase